MRAARLCRPRPTSRSTRSSIRPSRASGWRPACWAPSAGRVPRASGGRASTPGDGDCYGFNRDKRKRHESEVRMKDLSGRLAVVTGGGSGMGRELVRQLVAEGCSIATCDVSVRGLAGTRTACEREGLPQGVRITTHIADVSDESQVLRFRDEAAAQHQTDRIHLLFNNA